MDDHQRVLILRIGGFTGLCPGDVYRKIAFIYDGVVDITVRREGTLDVVDWSTVGRRFAIDALR